MGVLYVRSWIKSKNSLVKHFEDMRLCRPSKEYLPVWFDPPRDVSMSCLTTKGMRNNGAMCARQSLHLCLILCWLQPTQMWSASSERLFDEQPSPAPAPLVKSPNEALLTLPSTQPSEVPFEQQPDPSPRPSPRPSPKPSPTPIVPDSIPEPIGENLGDHSSNDTSLSGNKDEQTLKMSMIFVSLLRNRQELRQTEFLLRSFKSKKESMYNNRRKQQSSFQDTKAAQTDKIPCSTKIKATETDLNQESIKKSYEDY
ncbi:hypothetical protein Tco_0709547 [Tanacetum coccineum]